jgi:hypothetical protein
MASWQERKSVGDALEERVARELGTRGWQVGRYGQRTLPEPIRTAISRSTSGIRYLPDLIAFHDRLGPVIVDCKDRLPTTSSRNYAINKACLNFGSQFAAIIGAPLYYVFGNLSVIIPAEIIAYRIGDYRVHGSYYLIPDDQGHDFDQVFGQSLTLRQAS